MPSFNDAVKTDLVDIVDHLTKDSLNNLKILWSKKNCITVVLCAKGISK